jgi:hypothetical protein
LTGPDTSGDFQRLGHAAETGFAALGHLARVRPDDVHTVAAKLRQIARCRLGGPHLRIHRRRDQDRFVGGEQHGGGEIVGMAARHLRQQIGRRRRDDNEIGVARQTNVADIELAVRIEQVGENALAAQRAGGERRDEMLRGGGEDTAHLGAAVLQAADQVERFVGGDAAADDEQHAGAVRFSRARLLPRRL